MQYHEFGDKRKPHIMMIHGGGNAWWNYLRQARLLSDRYHVILPTLDGHGEEWETDYVSTEDCADKLAAYIDECCGGRLFFLCGVSLGGQIVMELLSRRPDITQKAVIDGSLCIPQPVMARYCKLTVRLLKGMMFGRTACKWQLAMLQMFPKMRYPQELADYYLQDMPKLPLKTLYTIYETYMAQYRLKESVSLTTSQVMYWYGAKEMKCVKESASLFKQLVPSCEIYEAKSCNHGYLAIYMPDEWMKVVLPFLEKK